MTAPIKQGTARRLSLHRPRRKIGIVCSTCQGPWDQGHQAGRCPRLYGPDTKAAWTPMPAWEAELLAEQMGNRLVPGDTFEVYDDEGWVVYAYHGIADLRVVERHLHTEEAT